ncbi:MAG: thermonuclease family protein, partial [Magnetococcales bacterium]|nr:thermonuclease family protein [Magnetococcales bacterium]
TPTPVAPAAPPPSDAAPPAGAMVAQVLREAAPTAETLAPPPPIPRGRVEFAAAPPRTPDPADALAARQAGGSPPTSVAPPGGLPDDAALAALSALSGKAPTAPGQKPPWPASSLVTAKVTAVLPGCRVEVELHNWRYEAALAAVRCPDDRSPFAARAQEQMRQLILEQNVVVSGKGGDAKSGGMAVDLFTPDGPLLNRELVRQGLARDVAGRFAQEEREAQSNRAGVWTSPQGE